MHSVVRLLVSLAKSGRVLLGLAMVLVSLQAVGSSLACSSLLADAHSDQSIAETFVGRGAEGLRIFDQKNLYELDTLIVDRLLSDWYGGYARSLKEKFLRTLSVSQMPVLLDPGIATRLPQFLEWAKAHRQLSPYQLRQGFADTLGFRRVYRGMILTPDAIEEIRRHGIMAQGFSEATRREVMQAEFAQGSRLGFVNDVTQRLYGRDLGRSPLISVTNWIEATSAGAWRRDGTPLKSQGQFYLFEMDVPEISVLRLDGAFQSLNNSVGSWKYFVTKKLFSDEDLRLEVRSPDFEMFIFGIIPPQEIRQIHAYDQMPPRWWPANDDTPAGAATALQRGVGAPQRRR